MPFRRHRVIEPELLDDQTPERAAPSLRDIVRINRLCGGHEVLRKCLRGIVQPGESFSFLDVGAGSGDASAVVRREYPTARTVSLDYRLHHVARADGARVVGDAFELPLRPRAFDVVYCGLFLHHFTDDQVVALLGGMARVSRRWVVVNDLERRLIAWLFLPATRWLFGWDPLTLHDGPISVQAGFTCAEMHDLGRRAGLVRCDAKRHGLAYRVSLVAETDDKLR